MIINEKGPMKEIADRYVSAQIEKMRKELKTENRKREQSVVLTTLQHIEDILDVIMKQNQIEIAYLEKIANGPQGDVHYIKLENYQKSFGKVFIDFERGDKNGRSRLPPNSKVTYPYSHVFMLKITNDGPAPISFQTNRHAHMIDLHQGESDTVSENENFQLKELTISNDTDLNANVRIVVYA